MIEPQGTVDFFISYRGQQAEWARWVNWVVRKEGFSTILMEEFPVGSTWTADMRDAATQCRRLIPLYSSDYWSSGACVEEFDAYWLKHLQNKNARFLLPLTIQDCTIPDIHAPLLTARLFGLVKADVRKAIRKVLKGITSVAPVVTPFTEKEPPFPGSTSVSAVPGSAAPTGSAVAAITPFPASPVSVDRKGFLNCSTAFTAFEQMLTTSAEKRILLVEGHGNQGKTTLLSKLYLHTRGLLGPKIAARVEFKQAGLSPEAHVAAIARAMGVPVPDDGNIDDRVAALLDACAGRPVVIFFDAYEHAELQHRHWVGRVLDRCLDDDNLRCVVAGRDIPPYTNQPWADLVVATECDALKDNDAIIAHLQSKGYQVSPDTIVGFVGSFVRMRERAISTGNHDHPYSCQVLLQELESFCGGTKTT